MGFPIGSDSKNSACQCRRRGFKSYGKIWRRKWQPTSVLLPGESHRWRSLVGYSPRSHKESDTTEVTDHAQCNDLTHIYNDMFTTISLVNIHCFII